MFRPVNRLGRRAGDGQLSGQSLARIFNKGFAGGCAELPERGVGEAANVLLQVFRRPQPAAFSTGFRPEIVGCRRVPGRHVHSVGHVSDGHFVLWPVGKKRLKEVSADFPMQATHAIHRPAPPDCQIGHVEGSPTSRSGSGGPGPANRGVSCRVSSPHTPPGIVQ